MTDIYIRVTSTRIGDHRASGKTLVRLQNELTVDYTKLFADALVLHWSEHPVLVAEVITCTMTLASQTRSPTSWRSSKESDPSDTVTANFLEVLKLIAISRLFVRLPKCACVFSMWSPNQSWFCLWESGAPKDPSKLNYINTIGYILIFNFRCWRLVKYQSSSELTDYQLNNISKTFVCRFSSAVFVCSITAYLYPLLTKYPCQFLLYVRTYYVTNGSLISFSFLPEFLVYNSVLLKKITTYLYTIKTTRKTYRSDSSSPRGDHSRFRPWKYD